MLEYVCLNWIQFDIISDKRRNIALEVLSTPALGGCLDLTEVLAFR